MSILPKVDVFKCDKCGKSIVAETHEIIVSNPYCWTSKEITLNDENIENAEMNAGEINTIELPYVDRTSIEVSNKGALGVQLGAPRGRLADEIKTTKYHVCGSCMNEIKEDFVDLMNANQEFQEKYFDSSFN